jgi:M6 family metalloprotease-like protein
MKKLYFLCLCLLVALATKAVEAFPYPEQAKQPDGTTLTIQAHGDEWFNYVTTADGYTVVKNDKGYFVYAQLVNGAITATSRIAREASQRSSDDKTFLNSIGKNIAPDRVIAINRRTAKVKEMAATPGLKKAINSNKFRGLVLLLQFLDRPFIYSDAHTLFNNMINGEGYTGFTDFKGKEIKYTGSVYDFFNENSNGNFKPQFDVYGPIKVPYEQTYADQASGAPTLIKAALKAINDTVDFKKYDSDGDGTVDMVYLIVSGAGSNYGLNDPMYLWPHASSLSSFALDGVSFGRYACSTELYGLQTDSIIDGMGTICHEFGHVLGLSDLYDTNYTASGLSSHPGYWSIMASGNYLNKSRSPAGYSLYERYAMGWTKPEVIYKAEKYTVKPLQTSNAGYRINSAVNKEFFLIENRQNVRWDSYLRGHGMLVWRVDSTNPDAWTNNRVNVDTTHNYYQLVRAAEKDTSMEYDGKNVTIAVDYKGDPFPGFHNVTKLINGTTKPNITSWTGNKTEWTIDSIAETDGDITFNSVRDSISSYIEPFEEMDTTTGDTIGIQGTFSKWTLNSAIVCEPDSGLCVGKKAIGILRGGAIFTTDTISYPVSTVRFNFYNPTSSTTIIRCYYSTNNGQTWFNTPTYSGEQIVSVSPKTNMQAEFKVGSTLPTVYRIYEFSGSTSERCYIDNVEICYVKSSGVDETHFTASKSALKVQRNGDQLTVNLNGKDGTVYVYNAAGAVVTSAVTANGTATMTLPQHGFYIVTSAGNSAKVIY